MPAFELPLMHKAYAFIRETRSRAYDWRHGVDTCGFVTLDDVSVVGSSGNHGRPYAPTNPKFLLTILSGLDIDYTRFQFIDVGSGKGRALLIASEFPFRRVTGVEFVTELHKIAVENVVRFRGATQRCRDIVCLNQDAAEFEFPPEPTVVFMANPFGPGLFGPVMKRLQASLEKHPRQFVLLYEYPTCADLVEQETSLRFVGRTRYHNAYANFDLPHAG